MHSIKGVPNRRLAIVTYFRNKQGSVPNSAVWLETIVRKMEALMLIPATGLTLEVKLDPDTELRLIEPLGGGAFGDVFKALGTSSGKVFAVKFPKLAFSRGDEIIAFQNEVKAAQEIHHPNVVKVLYTNTEPLSLPPYLVMEFINGGTLKARLDSYRHSGNNVPLEILRKWSKDLIAGITAINSKMLHRDLKPDNILVDGNTLKVGDFGLSKIVGAVTRTHTFKGGQHVLYMAPEGWKLETNHVQIDMYAMGIILFEMASLQYPYNLPSQMHQDAIRDMHLFQTPKSLKQLRPELPIGFCHIVTRLLEKRYHARYSNWEEVEKAFEMAWKPLELDESERSQETLSSLLEQTEILSHIHASKRLEEEMITTMRQEKHKLDIFQQENLVKGIRILVSEFNARSSLGQIRENSGFVFVLPYGNAKNGSSLEVDFFEVDPPLDLKRGKVSFAATLNDSGHPRLNYLLCRQDESDLYGQWIVCEARNHAFVKPDKRRRSPFEPFGFHQHEIRQIEISDHAMHVYTVRFQDNYEEAFLNAISESMNRVWNK